MSEHTFENETPVFTEYEAWVLAMSVAHLLEDDPDQDVVAEHIRAAIPMVLTL